MSTMNNEAKDLFDYFMQNVNMNFKINGNFGKNED